MSAYDFGMILERVSKNGVSLASFAEAARCNRNTLSRWKNGRRKQGAIEAAPRLTKLIARRGEALLNVSLDKNRLDTICERYGISQLYIASQMWNYVDDKKGISKQAYHKAKLKGFTPERKREIEQILRNIGKELLQLSKRAA